MDQPTEITLPEAGVVEPLWARRVVVWPILVVLSLIGGLLPSFSLAANVYVVVLGTAMAWVGFARKVPHRQPLRRVGSGVRWWLLPVGVFAFFESTTFLGRSTYAYPTLSLLVDPVLSSYLPRALVYLVWLAGFWGLCRR